MFADVGHPRALRHCLFRSFVAFSHLHQARMKVKSMRRRYRSIHVQSGGDFLTNLVKTQVKIVEGRIRMMGITTLEAPHFSYALHSTNDDVDKAVSLLLLLEDSIEGIIRSYTPNTKLLGAENRHGVTCYLDALLFAMFARLDCFEAILYKTFNDEPRRKLAILLRFWVNLLRSGKLITTDIVS